MFFKDFSTIFQNDDIEALKSSPEFNPSFSGKFFLDIMKLQIEPFPEKCAFYLSDETAKYFDANISQGIFLFSIAGQTPYFKMAFEAHHRHHPKYSRHLLIRQLSRFITSNSDYQELLPQLIHFFTWKEIKLAFKENNIQNHDKNLIKLFLENCSNSKFKTIEKEVKEPFLEYIEYERIKRTQQKLNKILPESHLTQKNRL